MDAEPSAVFGAGKCLKSAPWTEQMSEQVTEFFEGLWENGNNTTTP